MDMEKINIIASGSSGNAVVINKEILIDCGVAYKHIKPVAKELKIVLQKTLIILGRKMLVLFKKLRILQKT